MYLDENPSPDIIINYFGVVSDFSIDQWIMSSLSVFRLLF